MFNLLCSVLFLQDNGYVQLASTEKLRPYIQSNTVVSKSTREPTTDIGSRMVTFYYCFLKTYLVC